MCNTNPKGLGTNSNLLRNALWNLHFPPTGGILFVYTIFPCTHTLGCNNGGGGGKFLTVKRWIAKWIGTQKQLFSAFLLHRWDFRPFLRSGNAGTFFKIYFTHKPINACLPLFMGSWNMHEHWDSDLFWFGDGRICGGFPPLLRFV